MDRYKNEKELCTACIKTWGIDAQLNQAVEELAELIVAINHWRRQQTGYNRENLAKEIADVEIMLNQLTLIMSSNNSMFDCLLQASRVRVRNELEQRLVLGFGDGNP